MLALHVKAGVYSLEYGMGVMELAESPLALREVEPLSQDVLRLAESSGCTAYDCEFVAVAQQFGVPLVTLDQKVLKAFPATAISLVQFTAG